MAATVAVAQGHSDPGFKWKSGLKSIQQNRRRFLSAGESSELRPLCGMMAADPDPERLAKLLPRFEKLLKCEAFKAKPALLTLIESVVEAGALSSHGALRNLVPCVVEFLSSSDWAARKAAAEALVKLAVVERDLLSEFKAGCLKAFENRRYDKVFPLILSFFFVIYLFIFIYLDCELSLYVN